MAAAAASGAGAPDSASRCRGALPGRCGAAAHAALPPAVPSRQPRSVPAAARGEAGGGAPSRPRPLPSPAARSCLEHLCGSGAGPEEPCPPGGSQGAALPGGSGGVAAPRGTRSVPGVGTRGRTRAHKGGGAAPCRDQEGRRKVCKVHALPAPPGTWPSQRRPWGGGGIWGSGCMWGLSVTWR